MTTHQSVYWSFLAFETKDVDHRDNGIILTKKALISSTMIVLSQNWDFLNGNEILVNPENSGNLINN